jgi:hypothetical protein
MSAPALSRARLLLTATFMLAITNWIIDWWGDVGDLEPRLMQAVEIFLGGCRTL